MSEGSTIVAPANGAARKDAPLPDHREAVANLLEQCEDMQIGSLAGNVVSERVSRVGLRGAFALEINQKDQTYRIKEALLVGPEDSVEGARWIEVKSNTTLRRLLSKHGADLLGYDARSRTITFEILSLELFETSIRSVRILVRAEPQ